MAMLRPGSGRCNTILNLVTSFLIYVTSSLAELYVGNLDSKRGFLGIDNVVVHDIITALGYTSIHCIISMNSCLAL